MILGEVWDADPAADRSIIACPRPNQVSSGPVDLAQLPPVPGLNADNLGRMVWCFGLKRIDCNQHMWDIVDLPMKTATPSMQETLRILGTILTLMRQANDDLPPMCLAWDLHLMHTLVNRALLGLVHTQALEIYPFWRDCQVRPSEKLPFWRYSTIWYKGVHPVFGACDSDHNLKRVADHLYSGRRTVTVGGLPVDFCCMLRGSIPPRAYTFEDMQSDKLRAQRLSATYMTGVWHDVGAHIMCYIVSLISSVWSSSLGTFSPEEMVLNAYTGYILLLLAVAHMEDKHGERWPDYFLPKITTLNMLDLAGHAIQRLIHFPAGAPFHFRKTREDSMEKWFARTKSHCRGQPTYKDYMQGAFLTHIKQLHDKRNGLPGEPVPDLKAIPSDQAARLASRAVDAACTLHSVFTGLQKPANVILADFQCWWSARGRRCL